MPSELQRILELALENLESKKKLIETEMAEIQAKLKGRAGTRGTGAIRAAAAVAPKRRARFSKEERTKRSQRMKAYWDKWRKEHSKKK
jgi:hypothetical protein